MGPVAGPGTLASGLGIVGVVCVVGDGTGAEKSVVNEVVPVVVQGTSVLHTMVSTSKCVLEHGSPAPTPSTVTLNCRCITPSFPHEVEQSLQDVHAPSQCTPDVVVSMGGVDHVVGAGAGAVNSEVIDVVGNAAVVEQEASVLHSTVMTVSSSKKHGTPPENAATDTLYTRVMVPSVPHDAEHVLHADQPPIQSVAGAGSGEGKVPGKSIGPVAGPGVGPRSGVGTTTVGFEV